MLDMPPHLSSLMSAQQCGACPQFGEQFDTLSSEWSHVGSRAAATKFEKKKKKVSFSPTFNCRGKHLSVANHSNNLCLA